MRELEILTFVAFNGVMQVPVQLEEDRSGGFKYGDWAREYFDEVMVQVSVRLLMNARYGGHTFELA